MVGDDAQRLLGLGRPENRILTGAFQRAVPVQQGNRMIQITVLLTALLNRPFPKGAFIGIRSRNRADHRQGQFAFAEIVAHILAGGLGAAVIQ